MIDKPTQTYQFGIRVTKVISFCNYLFQFVSLLFRLNTNSFISNVDVEKRQRIYTTPSR